MAPLSFIVAVSTPLRFEADIFVSLLLDEIKFNSLVFKFTLSAVIFDAKRSIEPAVKFICFEKMVELASLFEVSI